MTFKVNELLSFRSSSYNSNDRLKLFIDSMKEMAIYHYENCQPYQNFCKNNNFNPYLETNRLADYPYIPVNIFKSSKLASVPESQIVTTVQSSATTSGIPSKIPVDFETSKRQTIASSSVLKSFLFPKRHHFFILDSDPKVTLNPEMTARIAATRGFLILAKNYEYFMNYTSNGKLSLDTEKFINFCSSLVPSLREQNINLTIFGFTFIIYEYLIKNLQKRKITVNLRGAKLAHIGGWKKLSEKKVDSNKFKSDIQKTLGVLPADVVDFYGFTEQMGIIYGENSLGYKMTSAYSEIIIRDPNTLEPVEDGQIGLIQALSPIFSSYPGISVLTEDLGRIVSREISPCGRQGISFEVVGRAEAAEVRGCGDLMEEKMVF